jgi:hypothetical protein
MVGSSPVVAEAGLASSAGGRARRRREAWPKHGDIVRSSESGSFTEGEWGRGCKEFANGSACSLVHVRRWAAKVR